MRGENYFEFVRSKHEHIFFFEGKIGKNKLKYLLCECHICLMLTQSDNYNNIYV